VKARKKIRRASQESGIALLLSIFVLLLVCVVGIAMLSASGTETSLTGNYRSATAVYYAALSGLEEGRGRLLPRNPNYLGTTVLPPTLPLGNVIYIKNPLPGDPPSTIDPTNLGNPATFPDTDYAAEFPGYSPPSNVQIVSSAPTITSPANSPNPLYKWVRINALTENALQINVNCSGGGGCGSGGFNTNALIYFDGANLTRTVTPYQALEVTALGALPDGSRKLLQYVVAPVKLQIPIAAALTLAGPGTPGYVLSFNPSSSATSFYVNGNDQQGSGGLACPAQPALPGVGVYNGNDYTSVYGNLSNPPPRAGHYTGAGGSTPNVSNPYVHPSNSSVDMTDPVSLGNLVQTIQGVADAVLTGPVTGSDMPSAMTAANPMTVVVNGDLTLTNFTGYGLLVVTGKLTYADDSGWKGIVLVIGQGVVDQNGSGSGNGEFDGALFVANTNGASLGTATYTVSSGKGIYYDSCWIAQALSPSSYKVLSFHEIPYP
jgi:hypothetical protein